MDHLQNLPHRFWRELNELIHEKHLERCLFHCKSEINVSSYCSYYQCFTFPTFFHIHFLIWLWKPYWAKKDKEHHPQVGTEQNTALLCSHITPFASQNNPRWCVAHVVKSVCIFKLTNEIKSNLYMFDVFPQYIEIKLCYPHMDILIDETHKSKIGSPWVLECASMVMSFLRNPVIPGTGDTALSSRLHSSLFISL